VTPEPAVLPAGKVNRFEVFHHYRKEHPYFYVQFEQAVSQLLMRRDIGAIVPARVLRDTLSRDYPWVQWSVDGIDVFKAMLAWYRHKNPTSVSRFRRRKTERGRVRNSGVDWVAKSRQNVPFSTLMCLVGQLRKDLTPTTMTLLKRDAGVRFNQNYNAGVAKDIRFFFPHFAHLIPARRNRVR